MKNVEHQVFLKTSKLIKNRTNVRSGQHKVRLSAFYRYIWFIVSQPMMFFRLYASYLMVLALLFVPKGESCAQTDTTARDTLDYYEMSLEQLLSIKAHGVPSELEELINSLISVASKKPLSARESPSIVSLITREEIRQSGARDLIDVLRLVPGLDFGADVESVVGLGVRGNWAHEGKVLLLIDGQEMNEVMFATTQFGNHFPIELIKKVEIIRGPGSAIYGGFAEYGVINIVTQQGEDIKGVQVAGTYGQMSKTFGRRNVNLAIGDKKGDFEYSLSGMIGEGNRSDQTYSDFYGSSYDMTGNAALNPAFVNLGLKYKGLSFRAMGDFFGTTVRDGYDYIKSGTYNESFHSFFGELKYEAKLNKDFTLTPRLNFKQQEPWKTAEVDSTTPAYAKTAQRLTANVSASWNINRYINLVFGGETFTDIAKDNVEESYFSDSTQKVQYYNYAFFAQGLIKTRFVNIILGARYDQHNIYGDAFNPRVGLTKKLNKFHFKVLYSSAFRAPSIENINLSTQTGIKPEKTQVAEIELGYQVTRKSIFTVNFFDITTHNPIVYFYDDANFTDTYINFGSSGTSGIEAEYRIKAAWGTVGFNYSFYSAAGKNKIADYEVSEDAAALLGFANHKVNLFATWNILPTLSVNVNASIYGARWAYTSIDTAEVSVLEKLDPTALVNVYLRYTLPVKGLSIGVGVYDLLDKRFKFVQPYDGYHAPLPGPSREFVFRLQYDLGFKPKKKKTE